MPPEASSNATADPIVNFLHTSTFRFVSIERTSKSGLVLFQNLCPASPAVDSTQRWATEIELPVEDIFTSVLPTLCRWSTSLNRSVPGK